MRKTVLCCCFNFERPGIWHLSLGVTGMYFKETTTLQAELIWDIQGYLPGIEYILQIVSLRENMQQFKILW